MLDAQSESIAIQREMIASMHKHGPATFCCNDPSTGKPLTFADMFNMHARTLLVITEVEQRAEGPAAPESQVPQSQELPLR